MRGRRGGDGVAGDRRRVAEPGDGAVLDPWAAECRRVRTVSGPVPVTVVHTARTWGSCKTVNQGFRPAAGDVVMLERGHGGDGGVVGPAGRRGRRGGRGDGDAVDVFRVDLHVADGGRSTRSGCRGDDPRIDECAEFVARHSPAAARGDHRRRVLHVRDPRGARPVRPARRGGVRARLRRGGRLLPAGHPPGLRHLVEDSTFVHHRGGVSFGDERESEDGRRLARSSTTGTRSSAGPRATSGPRPVGGVVRGARAGVAGARREPAARAADAAQPAGRAGRHREARGRPAGRASATTSTSRCCTRSSRGSCCAPCGTAATAPSPSASSCSPAAPAGSRRPTTPRRRRRCGWRSTCSSSTPSTSRTSSATRSPRSTCSPASTARSCARSTTCSWPARTSRCSTATTNPAASPRTSPTAPTASPRPSNLDLDDLDRVPPTMSPTSRHRRPLGVREPERGRLLPARLRHRPRPHGDHRARRGHPDLRPPTRRRGLVLDEPLRVAFVGLGWAKKGLDAVNQLADELAETTIEIHHFGEPSSRRSPELHAHGTYDNEFLPELLHLAGIQIVLLPGPYAETFGIVMTEALAAGIPVIGARYGALGERIRAYGVGWTIDPDEPHELTRPHPTTRPQPPRTPPRHPPGVPLTGRTMWAAPRPTTPSCTGARAPASCSPPGRDTGRRAASRVIP